MGQVQVIDRVGAILRAFSTETATLTLGEVSKRAGLTKSSTHRLLVALEQLGLTERDSVANWHIGPFALELAAVRMSYRGLRTVASVGLAALGTRFEAATALSVPSGTNMVYVERTPSPRPFAPAARLGSVAPMWAGAAGRAWLAGVALERRADLLVGDEWERLDRKLKMRIQDEIENAAERGYSVDRGDMILDVAGVAVAILGADEPVASLSLIFSPERLEPSKVSEMGQALLDLVRSELQFAELASTL